MLQETIILTALYILIIGILYVPKCPAQTATETAINYFPDVEESPEKEPTVTPAVTLPPSSESLESSENAIAAIPTPSETVLILADKPAAVTISPDLKSLSIRQLKKMAQGRVKGYSSLTKSQLIQALAA
ncbi:MAG: hypothetical protein ACKN9E_08245 [Microcystaceae cyanobacterium]